MARKSAARSQIASCAEKKFKVGDRVRWDGGGKAEGKVVKVASTIDFRRHPEHYRIGRGEQGVLLVEPYKSEILPHWRFKTPQLARQSADKIYRLFLEYKAAEDFVGMDMARKFLQMGYTRSRRYANRRSGRKYSKGKLLPKQEDGVKAESARILYAKWRKVREDETYLKLKRRHRELYEQVEPNKS